MISVQAKACVACAKAKRRCDKQLPECSRCSRQRLGNCTYPPALSSRQSARPARPASDYHYQSPAISTPDEGASYLFDEPSATRTVEPAAGTVPSPAATTPSTWAFPSNAEVACNDGSPSLSDAQSAWFLTPETWEIVKLNTVPNRPIRFTIFDEFVATLQSWLADWSRTGSNAFIHSELYASRIPSPISDVFTTLASYFHRSPETEPMVFRIIEDRITALVASEAHEPPDVVGHLSRVHALLGYSIICLFHGDIRLRRIAEVNLEVLVSWAQAMLKATARAASNGQLLHSEMVNALTFFETNACPRPVPPQHELQATWQQLGQAEKETALWHSWVVAESVRRAWVTARGVETIYTVLRDRDSVCPGGVTFTMSKSIWEANSALAWTKACAESDRSFLHIWDTERLCSQPTSEAMDEFAKTMIKLNFRTDRASTWVRGG